MPIPTVDEFWSLLARSRIADAGAVEGLRAASARAGVAGDVRQAAQWLVDRGVLTRWQAKRLASGDRGPFFLGDYRLLERHERQGDGLLFSARHDPSGRGVTLMLLNPRRCKDLATWTSIVKRTTAAHRATDPLLSRTWALEQAEGSRFIVCETVTGEVLADELARLGPLPPPQAGVLALQVARAVAEIHAAGAVHGGLSLDVLIREPASPGAPDRTGRVRLLQFPLLGDPHAVQQRAAVASDEEVDALGRRASFVAPELLLPDQRCDARSDVYAIGCILHALLTGVPPCWQGGPQDTLRQAAFAGPAALGPPVPPDMATVVGSLTARDPDARYQTAADAAEAIAACCGVALAAEPGPQVAALPIPAEPPPAAADQAAGDLLFDAAPRPVAVRAGGPAVAAATAAARRRAAALRRLGLGAAVAVLAIVAAVVFVRLDPGKPSGARATGKPPADPPARQPQDATPAPTRPPVAGGVQTATSGSQAAPPPALQPPGPPERQQIVDDPQLPWASPTSGPPPRLAFLPPGSQLVLLARPAAALARPEGGRFQDALGPAAAAAAGRIAAWTGAGLADIDLLQVGWQAGRGGDVLAAYAIRVAAGRSLPADEATREAAWGPTTAAEIRGQTVHKGQQLWYWVPAADAGRTLVVAPAELMEEIVEAASAAAADGPAVGLPKDLERLVGMLDAERHVTLFGSPHYLVHDGRLLLVGPLARLADPLAAMFGDAVHAAALAVHFGERTYAEIDAVAAVESPAPALARTLTAAVKALPETVEEYCARLDPAPYGKRLILRLPTMVRAVAGQLRVGIENRGVVLNVYLPEPAAHNLALAAELALAQAPGARAGAAAPGTPAAPAAALGRLQKKITLVFVKDTLEKTIQLIADEIGVPMEILGPDLQLEGITKNQSFGLDETDKTAEAVLRTVLAKANPDGKLVFVVRRKDGEETIEITTRAAAQKRGDPLPAGQ